MKNIKLIIFDMDGVLVDSEKIWKKKEINFMKKFSSNFSSQDQEKIVGGSIFSTFNFLKEFFHINISFQQFEKEYETFGLQQIYPKVDLMPGVKNFLEFASKKFLLALGSNSHKSWINTVVNQFDIKKFFQTIVSAQDVKNGKPSPDIFLQAAKNLKILSKNCLVLEDSEKGVLAAKKAKMKVFAIKNETNKNQNTNLADDFFENFLELQKNIDR